MANEATLQSKNSRLHTLPQCKLTRRHRIQWNTSTVKPRGEQKQKFKS